MMLTHFIGTSELNDLCNDIATELESMRNPLQNKRKWQDRMDRREEAWERIEPTIFEDVISKEGYPESNVSESHWLVIMFSLLSCLLSNPHLSI